MAKVWETYVVMARIPGPGDTAPTLRFEVTAPDPLLACQHVRVQLGMCAQVALVDPEEGELIAVTGMLPRG